MLHFVTFPMHLGGGRIVTLQAILQRLPRNDLLWRVLHFTGVGQAPEALPMQAFEDAVRSSPDGYSFTWDKLRAFASEMEQVWDCLIVASQPQILLSRDSIDAGDFSDCEYVIDAFDSTEWKVGAKDESVCTNLRDVSWVEVASVP